MSDLAREFVSHFSTYLSTQWDLACLSVWSLAVRVVFLVSVAVLLVAASVTVGIMAIHYVMSGLAGGIGSWAGDRLWLGRLVTGLFVLVVFATTVGVVVWRYQVHTHRQLRRKYEPGDHPHDESTRHE